MIVDANNQVLGRLATYVAKQALSGESVNVINCEKVLISGDRSKVFEKIRHSRNDRGEPFHGPFISRMPDRLVRRMIRGMLPFKQARGREAFKRIMCYMGVPKEFEGKDAVKPKGADASKLPNLKFVRIEEVSRMLGAKI